MTGKLTKYVIGLAVLGIFTLVLVVIVGVQAAATKHDSEVYKAANSAADKLSAYVERQQKIPATLADAGVSNASDDVSYQKLDSSRYKFCVTYRADSSGFDPASVQSDITSAALGGSFSASDSGASDPAYLYLSSTHHKGENCQTIKPYIYSYDGGLGNSCSYDSKSATGYDDYIACLDKNNSSSTYQYN